ncbi:MAG: hypothetical protein HW401_650 [Parcubacteria group bacterium]|nr:hypothetical protein [Parcubacteria group bacterium]
MQKTPFVAGEFYHIYNRGVDKRNIVADERDSERFIQSMIEFNVIEPIGSIYENSFIKKQLGNETSKLVKIFKPKDKLVNIIAYCLNPNHFHFILEAKEDNGVSEFIKRVAGGYTKYFNNKHARSGSLFQGVFKSVHIDSNEYLLHLSAYVNINNEVHQLGNETSKLVRSSFSEYGNVNNIKTENELCAKDIILEQFKTRNEYADFAKDTVREIAKRRREDKDFEKLLLE